MTCREKLAMERPDCVRPDIPCGCSGCPVHYGYLDEPDWCSDGADCCTKCWDREFPGYTIDEKAEKELVEAVKSEWPKENPNLSEDATRAAKRMEARLNTTLDLTNTGRSTPSIKDSGNRREFASGAVRDMQEGKGRCDLMPLEVVAAIMDDSILDYIAAFKKTGNTNNLIRIFQMCLTGDGCMFPNAATMLLEVAKHFEEGAKKYGENNWQKGIPVNCYIDSAVRHYIKWRRGDTDEPHDRAFVWNLMCCIWEVDYRPKVEEEK